jgi:hypothetical protein
MHADRDSKKFFRTPEQFVLPGSPEGYDMPDSVPAIMVVEES